MLVEPRGQEVGGIICDVLLAGKPLIGPVVDLSEVNLSMSHVPGKVLASDTSPPIARVVLHICVVLAPEALVTDSYQVVRVNGLGVVGHHLDPVLHVEEATQALPNDMPQNCCLTGAGMLCRQQVDCCPSNSFVE